MDFSSLFVSDPKFSHLNAGTRTRTPIAVLEFMEKERYLSERNPTEAMFVGYNRIWEVQKRLAQFLGATAEDIFLRSNVTAAFSDFLFGLPALPAGEAVATGWEYGGIANLLQHWSTTLGHSFRSAPLVLREHWTEDKLAQAVLDSLGKNTRILLLSHVSTGTGHILPIQKISQEAKKRGVIVVVDGAHAVGSLPISMRDFPDLAFYGGNFHKWFLGPEGTGFGWVNPEWKGKIVWKFGGWASQAKPAFYQGFGGDDAESARRLFPGTIDRIPFLALGEVLDFWAEHGPEKIRARQAELRDLAASEAAKLGWERITPSDAGLIGPLVSFLKPAAWQGEATSVASRIYREAGVQLALPSVQNTGLVRFSPGIYATEAEITGAFARLARWK